MAIDLPQEKVRVPFIDEKSTDEDIANFYKSLNSHFNTRLYYYFVIEDLDLDRAINFHLNNLYEEIEKYNKNSDLLREEKFYESKRLILSGMNILGRMLNNNNFADANELANNGERFIVNKQFRLLFCIKINVEYTPITPDYIYILLREYARMGHPEVRPIVREYMNVYKEMCTLFLAFTKKNASIFYQLAIPKTNGINDKNYFRFLKSYLIFRQKYLVLLIKFTNSYAKIKEELHSVVAINLALKGIRRPALRVGYGFNF
jgi:hypothetical protein